MKLVDTNVFMYAAGKSHPLKAPSVELLRQAARGRVELAVDAEVLQEILHRYRSIRRWEDGRRVFDLTRTVVLHVIPITVEVLDAARRLMDEMAVLTARDAVHAAVARLTGAESFYSWDRDFDGIPGVHRVEPPGRE